MADRIVTVLSASNQLIRPSDLKYAGAYCITVDGVPGLYVGGSKNLYNRYRCHLADLRLLKHFCPTLQTAWNTGGQVTFRVLEACERNVPAVRACEQRWLDHHASQLLNASRFVCGTQGRPMSETLKKANRHRMLGNKCGEGKHYHGILTETDVAAILADLAAGGTLREVPTKYHVSANTISRIGRRQIWWNVPLPSGFEHLFPIDFQKRRPRAENSRHSKLTYEMVREIRSRTRHYGYAMALAKEFNISPVTVRAVRSGRIWGHVTA